MYHYDYSVYRQDTALMTHLEKNLPEELHRMLASDSDAACFLRSGAFDGFWFRDYQASEKMWLSPMFWKLLGYLPPTPPSAYSAWIQAPFRGVLDTVTQRFMDTGHDDEPVREQVILCPNKNGGSIWLHFRAVRISLDPGTPVALIGTFRDVTSALRKDEALRHEDLLSREMLNAANDAVVMIDSKGRTLDFNTGYAARQDKTRVELLGGNVWEQLPVSVREGRERLVRDAVNHGAPQRMTDQYQGLFDDVTVFPLPSRNGVIDRLVIHGHEITELMLSLQKLQAREALFMELFQSAGDALIVADVQANVLEANNSALQLFGYDREEFLGKNALDLISPESITETPLYIAKVMRGEGVRMERPFVRKDGSIFFGDVSVKGVAEARQVVIIRDITERRSQDIKLLESRELYRELVENAASIILRLDTQGRITFFNEYAEKLFGYTREEVIGQPVLGTIVPEIESTGRDLGRMLDELRTNPDRFLENENENLLKDGSRIWVRWANKALFDSQGNVTEILCVGVDISNRKHAEEELQKLWRAVENAPVSVVITNTQGIIEYVNPFFCTSTGYSAGEVLGDKPGLLNSGHHPHSFYTDMWKTLAAGKTWQGDICNRKKNGGLFWESASISPVFGENGKVTHYVAVKEDITARKELDNLREDVELIARHDLKGPLNGILGVPPLLLEAPNITEEQRDYLRLMQDSGHKMLDMINLSLTLYQIERGAYAHQAESFDILRLARQIMNDQKAFAKAHMIELDLAFKGFSTTPDKVLVNGESLLTYSIVSNLLKNALEASPRGETVTLSLKQKPLTLDLEIHNQGTVPHTLRETFFEKFATSGKSRGTGLGTYSAKLLAEVQGWRVGMRTSSESGTTLTIHIPI